MKIKTSTYTFWTFGKYALQYFPNKRPFGIYTKSHPTDKNGTYGWVLGAWAKPNLCIIETPLGAFYLINMSMIGE